MTVKLAINGFGRIGRMVLRALMEQPALDLEVIAINDLAPLETNAHLFEFDSVHGRYTHPVKLGKGTLDVGRGPMRVTAERDPADLPWHDVDIALECTGHFRSPDQAALHLKNGSKRVLLSAPPKGDIKTIVHGVNQDTLGTEDRIVSNASCTTNCLAPIAHVLHDAFGIRRGHMTTVHAYTGNQPVHDRAHSDLYRARAAALSMIPTSTGAADTLGLVLPELDGRISGTAVRVPTPNVSCVDLVVETERATTVDEVHEAMKKAASGPLRGVLGITNRQLGAIDFNHDPRSAIYASDQTSI
ncbi:MAG: type I glyceraldehyde-3-phosphate dehydrogenase, partial [Sulfitobacter sp.]|nr:type I glyceraldehyde-3-phosphate dehydrogenase [Sulfitobacter sp.]